MIPRLYARIKSKFLGLLGKSVSMNRTNSSFVLGCKAGLKRRSNPMVETTFPLKARPQVEPEKAPG